MIITRPGDTIQEFGRQKCSDSHIFLGCRSEMLKNDTVHTRSAQGIRIPWMKEDCIRWVEWRIRELTVQNGKYVDERGEWLLEEKAAGGRKLAPGDQVADYAVWLLKVRDNFSWHQIAYTFFPSATEGNIEKYESKVRRVYDRVEKSHPGSTAFTPPRLPKYQEIF